MSPFSKFILQFLILMKNIKNQNTNAKGKGEYVSLIGVYSFNGNEP